MQPGMASHKSSSPILLPILFQLLWRSKVFFGTTQFTPRTQNNMFCRFVVVLQWMKRWSIVSPSLHREGILSKAEDLFFVSFLVLSMLITNYQPSKTGNLQGNFIFPNEFPGPKSCERGSVIEIPVCFWQWKCPCCVKSIYACLKILSLSGDVNNLK